MYDTVEYTSRKPRRRGAAYKPLSEAAPRERALIPPEWQELHSYYKYHVLANWYSHTEAEEEHTNLIFLADAEIEKLHEWFEFRDEEAVKGFLRNNFFLVGLLSDAAEKIREYFGPDNPIALKVVKEPDATDDRRLFVFIPTKLSPREALARLDELDRDWWFNVLSRARGKLSIDVEYV